MERETRAPSDADLVVRARAGDVPSMGLLLERYRPALLAHAVAILGRWHADEVEDVVQEASLQALNRLAQLEEPAAFKGWLHAILRNVALQYLRRRRQATVLPLCDGIDVADESGPDLDGPSASIREAVWAAVGELPRDLQATILLRYFGRRHSYEGVAELLGVPVGTVRSRLHDARRRLADRLRLAAERDGGDVMQRLESRSRRLGGLLIDFYNEGRGDLFGLFPEDIEVRLPDESPVRGRVHLERDFRADRAAGVRFAADHTIGGSTVSIVQGQLLNPEDDPLHCPPVATLIAFHTGRSFDRVHIHAVHGVAAAR